MPDLDLYNRALLAGVRAMALAIWPELAESDVTFEVAELDHNDVYHPIARYDFDTQTVWVSYDVPLSAIPELLAHELAHRVAGYEAEHGQEWQRAFDALCDGAGLVRAEEEPWCAMREEEPNA